MNTQRGTTINIQRYTMKTRRKSDHDDDRGGREGKGRDSREEKEEDEEGNNKKKPVDGQSKQERDNERHRFEYWGCRHAIRCRIHSHTTK